jgi:probable phosphoglycerate mutase
MTLGKYYLLRHGETDWSISGQHTGRTDIPLTEKGRRRAAEVRPMLSRVSFGYVLCSPLMRARDTAALAGLHPEDYSDDLLEWNYGIYEGRTTAEIRAEKHEPNWLIWDDPIPGGESPVDVGIRCQRVLDLCKPYIDSGRNVALVAHGHLLRMLTATYLGLPARDGRMFQLDAGGISVLGHERVPVIAGWNITPDGLTD